MCGSVDTSPSQLHGLVVCEIPVVALVQDTVGKGGARADGEDVTLEARAIRIDVEECWTLLRGRRRRRKGRIRDLRTHHPRNTLSTHRLVPAANHSTHTEPHSLVANDEICQVLAGGGDGDSLLVSELMQAANAAAYEIQSLPRLPI